MPDFDPSFEELLQVHQEYIEWEQTGIVADDALIRQLCDRTFPSQNVLNLDRIAHKCHYRLVKLLLQEMYPVVEPDLEQQMNTYCEQNPAARECREYDC